MEWKSEGAAEDVQLNDMKGMQNRSAELEDMGWAMWTYKLTLRCRQLWRRLYKNTLLHWLKLRIDLVLPESRIGRLDRMKVLTPSRTSHTRESVAHGEVSRRSCSDKIERRVDWVTYSSPVQILLPVLLYLAQRLETRSSARCPLTYPMFNWMSKDSKVDNEYVLMARAAV